MSNIGGDLESKRSPEELLAELEGDHNNDGAFDERADDSGAGINLFDYLVKSTTKLESRSSYNELSFSSVHSSASTASRRRRQLRVKRYTEAGDEVANDIPESAPNFSSYEANGSSISSSFSSLNASGRSHQRSLAEGGKRNRSGRIKRYQARDLHPSTISSHGEDDDDDDDDDDKVEHFNSSAKNDTFTTISTPDGTLIIRNHVASGDDDEPLQQAENIYSVDDSTSSAQSPDNHGESKPQAEQNGDTEEEEEAPLTFAQKRDQIAQAMARPAVEIDEANDDSDVETDDASSSGSSSSLNKKEAVASPLNGNMGSTRSQIEKQHSRNMGEIGSVRMDINSGEGVEPEGEDVFSSSQRARESLLKRQSAALAAAAARRCKERSERKALDEANVSDDEFETNPLQKKKSVRLPDENGGYISATKDTEEIRALRRKELGLRKRKLEALGRAKSLLKETEDFAHTSTNSSTCRNNPTRQRTVNIDVYTGEVIGEMPKIGTILGEGNNGRADDDQSSSSFSSTEYDTPAAKRQGNLRLVAILLILVGTGLGVYFGIYFNRDDDEGDSSSGRDIPLVVETSAPSMAPFPDAGATLRPSSLRGPSPSSTAQPLPFLEGADEELFELLVEEWPILSEAIGQEASPQLRALQWLSLDEALTSYSTERKKQRFALATFFYSTDGGKWTQNDQWLSSTDECFWFSSSGPGLRCSSDGLYASLEMNSNGLDGTIPAELGLLSTLSSLNIADNNLGGSIPPEVGGLENLLRLDLSRNLLSGTIPSTLGNLPLLRDNLDLSDNQLTGTIPLDFGRLLLLRQLLLHSNQLTGEIPTSFRSLGRLTTLRVESNLLRGRVPESVCAAFNNSYPVFVADCVSDMECSCCSYCCTERGNCECQFDDISGLQFLCNGFP